MDTELKELAALALRNAFWSDFSALANGYLNAAKCLGIDLDAQERQMGDLTSIYGRDMREAPAVPMFIGVHHADGRWRGVASLDDALKDASATEVHLRGHKVFERRSGEWCYVEGPCLAPAAHSP